MPVTGDAVRTGSSPAARIVGRSTGDVVRTGSTAGSSPAART